MGYESSEFLLYLLPLLHSNCSISLLLATSVGMFVILAVLRWTSRGGCAWAMLRSPNTIPGPRGYPVLGSLLDMGSLAHRRLASLAVAHRAESLMSLSLGSTRLVIASKPGVARDILNSSSFADRPLKQSAQELMFGRAIGFAPYGEYWRGLRRIAANHLFSPRRIAAHEGKRQELTLQMLNSVSNTMATDGHVTIRKFLQHASLNSVLSSVFGRTFAFGSHSDTTASLLHEMVREGFELLGAFNWSDHLPILRPLDPACIQARCEELVPKVHSFVQTIIDEHRRQHRAVSASESDFVDVLLSLNGEDKLQDQDMVAVLWEMIFRGTDTTAILTEWILAELVLHPEIQKRVHQEIDEVVARTGRLTDLEISRMPLLQAVTKETLRVHPPGPLLSWARLATEDVVIAGHHVPAGTTAMVNMWAITHDPSIWENPESFNPDRFLGAEFDIKGTDLRLAPFGAGRRVCPGRALGVATVGLWLGKLLERFEFLPVDGSPVDLSEVLKLSCEMVNPLVVRAVERQTRSKA